MKTCRNVTYENLPTCSACLSGFYLSNNSCISCSSIYTECLTCNSSAQCTSCTSGFPLKDHTCHQCNSIYPQCTECNASSECIACSSGFILDQSACCAAYCVGCSSTLACDSCPDHCLRCDTTKCLECDPTYELNAGVCECPRYYLTNTISQECFYSPYLSLSRHRLSTIK